MTPSLTVDARRPHTDFASEPARVIAFPAAPVIEFGAPKVPLELAAPAREIEPRPVVSVKPSPNVTRPLGRSLVRAIVVLVAIGAPLVAFAGEKSVTVDIEGRVRHVHTYATSARSLLKRFGVRAGAEDLVTPNGKLSRGAHITFRRAKPITLLVDGKPTTVVTHGLTVGEGLADLGLRPGPKDFVYPAAPTSLQRGMSVSVRNAVHAKVRVDGRLRDVVSSGATVSELLGQAGVAVGPHDYVLPGTKAKPADGMWIRVVRVQRVITERANAVPFEDIVRRDPTMESGRRRVVQLGAEGLELRRTLTVIEDGNVLSRQLLSVKTIRLPQNRIVRIGTREPAFYGTGHSQDGLASWYRSDGLTAAHPSLPIGTIVRVTNTANGRSVNVRIVDRGPFVDGRVIDLSDEAFSRLASLGNGTIHVHVAY
jgi:uncharacterized protein YabE (DUF348 family)